MTKFSNFFKIRGGENETFKYTNDYCEMVEILLNFIKGDRSGDFELHLRTRAKCYPTSAQWTINYIRGIRLYLQDMMYLPANVLSEMRKEMCLGKRSLGKFNAVGCGHWRLNWHYPHWLILYPFKNAMHSTLLSHLGNGRKGTDENGDLSAALHSEWSQSRITKDEKDIQTFVEGFRACNPLNAHYEEFRLLHNAFQISKKLGNR